MQVHSSIAGALSSVNYAPVGLSRFMQPSVSQSVGSIAQGLEQYYSGYRLSSALSARYQAPNAIMIVVLPPLLCEQYHISLQLDHLRVDKANFSIVTITTYYPQVRSYVFLTFVCWNFKSATKASLDLSCSSCSQEDLQSHTTQFANTLHHSPSVSAAEEPQLAPFPWLALAQSPTVRTTSSHNAYTTSHTRLTLCIIS